RNHFEVSSRAKCAARCWSSREANGRVRGDVMGRNSRTLSGERRGIPAKWLLRIYPRRRKRSRTRRSKCENVYFHRGETPQRNGSCGNARRHPDGVPALRTWHSLFKWTALLQTKREFQRI